MGLTIREKAATVATFRSIQMSLMETLARWVPTTPEMEVKLLFGRHIWELAQHVDALGKRTYELRKPMQFSLPPSDAYKKILQTIDALQPTTERVYGFYDVMLLGLVARYRHYLVRTDSLLDAPTVRVLEHFLANAAQMRQEAQELCMQLPQIHLTDAELSLRLTHLESTPQDIVCQDARAKSPTTVETVALDPAETMSICGITLRCDPARDPCFTVVHMATEMHEYSDMSEVSRRERLHRHMNNEIGSLEIAAQCLADFPSAPWELRMQLARQCWDETRHVQLLYRRLQKLGGHKGEFPIANLEWNVTCMLDSLPARLAVQNRTFEAGQMDLLGRLVDRWRDADDETTAEMLEGILADEIQHVRFANQWIKRMVQEDRRVLLHITRAMHFLTRTTTALAPPPGAVNAVGTVLIDPTINVPKVNIEDRQHADFTAQEIHEVLRQAGFRSLIPRHEAEEVTS